MNDRKSKLRRGVDELEKFIVLGSSLVLLLIVLALMFLQQMVIAQGQGTEGFYQIFGGINMAGFMLAVPVTFGMGLQLWRISLYRRKLLKGQTLDYIITTVLILVAVVVDLYVFNMAPTRTLSPHIPRIVVSAWIVAHVVQFVVEFWTDWYAEQEEKEKAEQQNSFRKSSNERQSRQRKERTTQERESVSPKG